MIVCGIGLVLAIALFFVQTEFGELQAFITALQGVLIGFLGFFVGLPRRGAPRRAHRERGGRDRAGCEAGAAG